MVFSVLNFIHIKCNFGCAFYSAYRRLKIESSFYFLNAFVGFNTKKAKKSAFYDVAFYDKPFSGLLHGALAL